jgi:tRNA-dihydrouridine synthase
VVQGAADCGVSWVAIHGRTRVQGYSGNADWEIIRDVSEQSSIPIIGNGDICTASQAVEKLEKDYAHGVMIGRGALKNPWIFRQILGVENGSEPLMDLIERHMELAVEKNPPRKALLSFKKFFGWYVSGLAGASRFRERLFSTHDKDEVKALAWEFLGNVRLENKLKESTPLMMTGPG